MDFLPGHSLGWAIIMVTLIVKTIILIPSQKAIRSQRELQVIQPELAKLKEKYKNNPQLQAQKTMELYKEHKVNPFGSCLPLLIQFPILIAVFYVTRDIPEIQASLEAVGNPEIIGVQLENAQIMVSDTMNNLYPRFADFDFSNIQSYFLGVDLINKNFVSKFIMPLIVGFLQFGQMYRMQMRNKAENKDEKPVKKDPKNPIDPQAMQQSMMYFMPVMIAFFASQYPAGLSLYWAMSTLFSFVQQEIVFRTKKQ